MPHYVIALADKIQELKALVQKGEKGYRIRHAPILLKPDQKPETNDRIKNAYAASHSTIAGIMKRFVMGGMKTAPNRKTADPPSQNDRGCGNPGSVPILTLLFSKRLHTGPYRISLMN